MMNCPTCGHSDLFSVIEVIEQRTRMRCIDKDTYDCIEVEATLAHAWDTVTCSACGHAFDAYEGREAWTAAHGELQEDTP
jgi:rubredoxin